MLEKMVDIAEILCILKMVIVFSFFERERRLQSVRSTKPQGKFVQISE